MRRARERVAAFAPSIVVYASGESPSAPGSIEREWPASAPRPFHVFTGRAGAVASATGRVFALDAVPIRPNEDAARAWRASFPGNEAAARMPLTADLYDAIYLFAYSGGDFRRLAPGRAVAFGPSGYAAGIDALAHGESIAYQGVRGAMLFDALGERRADARVLCPTEDGEFAPSGLYVSGVDSGVLGASRCP